MIENFELAYDMAVAEAPFQEVAIEARQRNLNSLAVYTLNNGYLHSRMVLQKHNESERQNYKNDRFGFLDTVETTKLEYANRDDLENCAVGLGYKIDLVSRTWNCLIIGYDEGIPLVKSFMKQSDGDRSELQISVANLPRAIKAANMMLQNRDKSSPSEIFGPGFGVLCLQFLDDFSYIQSNGKLIE